MASENDLKIEIIVDEKGAIKGFDNLANALKKTNTTAEETKKGFSGLQASIVAIDSAINLAQKGFRLIAGMGKDVLALADAGDKLQDLQGAFVSLGGSAESLERATAAAQGLIDSTQLLQLANKALISDIPNINENFSLIVDAGTRLADTLGTDAVDATQLLTQAISMGNAKILKQAGIFLDTEKAVESFAKKNGVAADSLSDLGKRAAIQEAAIEQLKSKLLELPPVEDSVANATIKTKNTWNDLRATLGGVINDSPELTSELNNLSEEIKKIDVRALGEALARAGVSAIEFGKAVIGLTSDLYSLLPSIEAVENAGIRLSEILDNLSRGKFTLETPRAEALIGELEGVRIEEEKLSRATILTKDILKNSFDIDYSKLTTGSKEAINLIIKEYAKGGVGAVNLKNILLSVSDTLSTATSTTNKKAEDLSKYLGKASGEAKTLAGELSKAFSSSKFETDLKKIIKATGGAEDQQQAYTKAVTAYAKQQGLAGKELEAFIEVAAQGAGELKDFKTETQEVEDALKKAFGNSKINNGVDDLIRKMGRLPQSTEEMEDAVIELIPRLREMGVTGEEAINIILDRLNVAKDKFEQFQNESITGENFFTKFLGIDSITEANATSALADSLARAYSTAIEMAISGDTSGADVGMLIGTGIGTGIGAALGGAAGAAIGSQAGGTLGQLIGEGFDNDRQWTTIGTIIAPGIGTAIGYAMDSNKVEKNDKNRRRIAGLVEDIINEMNFQITDQAGNLTGFDDVLNLDFKPGSSFLTALDEVDTGVRNTFGGILGAFAELNDLDWSQGFGVGQTLLLQMGGDVDNLRLLVAQLGLTFEEVKEQTLDTFLAGQLSAMEYQSIIANTAQAFQPGLVAVGDLTKATQMLKDSAARGQVSVTSLRNVAYEAMDLNITSVEGLIQRLTQMGELSTADIAALYDALKVNGISTLDQLKTANDETIIAILATMQANNFSFSEALTSAQDQITNIQQLIDDLPDSITTNYKIKVSAEYDDDATRKLVNTSNFPGMGAD